MAKQITMKQAIAADERSDAKALKVFKGKKKPKKVKRMKMPHSAGPHPY